jgi:hypothetical protein
LEKWEWHICPEKGKTFIPNHWTSPAWQQSSTFWWWVLLLMTV